MRSNILGGIVRIGFSLTFIWIVRMLLFSGLNLILLVSLETYPSWSDGNYYLWLIMCSHLWVKVVWFDMIAFVTADYQGLTKSFCHGKIYCSSITAKLVNMKIGIPWDNIKVLPLNQKINIAGINVTCLDANHCPGSVIILFEPPNGKVWSKLTS